MIEYRIIVDVK